MDLDQDARDTLRARFAEYYDDDTYSDFIIKCDSTEWKVHRFVMSIHSDVLKKCCQSAFKEAQEGILDLSEHAVEEVEALVYFLYHWEYKLADDTSIFEDLCFHIDMALLADKYLVTGLVTVAKELFEFCLSDLEDDEELAELALKAYDSPDIIADMRSNIVNAVVEEKKMESKEVLQAMRTQGEFATDVALAMSKKAERSERSTRSHDGWGAWD
ncbi:unnamed protein product [Zymoseptoria tritici ST99CH_1A5]|uniref:BTB domain-containing protein n=2 Tax=Zymoseptoria tritici TaxID=1047171 RepID=A0A1X7RV35_ZYMT9|nr:unnamed protein product [Zymoseptoria tritici ST99CH_3D7]SMY24763.1 unnamed protein product [Zymoseptoria tritici ST99CH_1A5]